MSENPAPVPSPEYDAVVVGGGPAGLAAATWLVRFRKRTLVLDSCEYRNRWVEHAHGYLGMDPVNPGDLLDKTRQGLMNYPAAELVCVRVDGIETGEGAFVVTTEDHRYRAKRVVLATGTTDVFPDIPGFFEHYGSQVFHCPVCDGYEAKDKKVAVLGWNEDVRGFAVKLLTWARSVTVVAQGNRLKEDDEVKAQLARHGVVVCDEEAVELLGARGSLAGVRLGTGEVLDCDYLFFSLPERPTNALARQLGCEMDEDGHVTVDRDGRTSVDGVFAAGDLTPGEQLIQLAAAEGTLAGLACVKSLG
ncbi:MAG TPA: NAD(P)/FAD-dependent oxidoreductase [Actinomycetota bacterium]|nr:NAD(P)/FAD-dependent oxidoreductase [Actinomycetota bacterium]